VNFWLRDLNCYNCIVSPTQHRPNFISRECQSCRRDLSLDNYGTRLDREDRSSTECKECRRYRRKIYYYDTLEKYGRSNPESKARALPYIFPLNKQNRHVLSNIPPNILSHVLSAEFIKTGVKTTVEVRYHPEEPRIEIHYPNSKPTTFQFCPGSKDVFVDTAVRILHDLRIRLD